LRRSIEACLALFKMEAATLELSLVSGPAIRSLNRKFRSKDRVTDVLSFPLDRKPRGEKFPWHLGEIVIALPVARQQARVAGRPLIQQLTRLAVHGIVHLTGRDHEKNPAARRSFERLESKCLRHLQRKGLTPWDGSLRL
jgi:metalloprotein, YbeY/UPF0054 family